LLTFVALAATIGMFIAQNNRPVAVEIYHWQTSTLPLYLLVFFAMLFGAACAGFMGLLELVRVESRSRQLGRKLKTTQKEYSALKESLPKVETKPEATTDKPLPPPADSDYSAHQQEIRSFKKIP